MLVPGNAISPGDSLKVPFRHVKNVPSSLGCNSCGVIVKPTEVETDPLPLFVLTEDDGRISPLSHLAALPRARHS